MKNRILIMLLCIVSGAKAQEIKLTNQNLQPSLVTMSLTKMMGKDAVRVVQDTSVKLFDQPTFVKLKGIDFKDGTIEVSVLSKLLPNAPEFARGFIGISFRINDSSNKFENFYIRPTNGRANDQLRRNHTIQYFSYPGYDFDRFRKEAPGVYESYADMGLNEWIQMKLEVKGQAAQLYINGSKQPVLIVNDLKQGPNLSGSIGFWVGEGTEGYFADLKVKKN